MSNVDFGRYAKRIVRSIWDPYPRNDDPAAAPIWCLGTRYDARVRPASSSAASHRPPEPNLALSHTSEPSTASDDSEIQTVGSSVTDDPVVVENSEAESADTEPDVGEDAGWPTPFLEDFDSRLCFTYRAGFAPIPKSQDPKATSAMSFSVRLKSQFGDQAGFTSDSGWGCMIRSGQTVLANAMLMLRLGREWRRGSKPTEEREIISLFADHPAAPFSIHRFVEHGATACGKHPGEWFGPSATARCIQALCNTYDAAGLKVYITGDGADVYEDSFMSIAKSSGTFQPTLILVGTRLGISGVTDVYWEALKSTLQVPQSAGIAGGQPASSHYFLGTQSHFLFYLDPHTTQPYLPYHADPNAYTPEELKTCHTRRLRRTHIKDIDPSMLIAFLIRDEEDWKEWRMAVEEVQGKPAIRVTDKEPLPQGRGERAEAVDEVESWDEADDDEATVVDVRDVADAS